MSRDGVGDVASAVFATSTALGDFWTSGADAARGPFQPVDAEFLAAAGEAVQGGWDGTWAVRR